MKAEVYHCTWNAWSHHARYVLWTWHRPGADPGTRLPLVCALRCRQMHWNTGLPPYLEVWHPQHLSAPGEELWQHVRCVSGTRHYCRSGACSGCWRLPRLRTQRRLPNFRALSRARPLRKLFIPLCLSSFTIYSLEMVKSMNHPALHNCFN